MPTYQSISFQYSKSRITKETVQSFCDALLGCGLSFAGGVWGCEDASYADIIRWNQRKLEENFQLGLSEHHSHDFRQMLLSHPGFSEVRLILMNMRDAPYFSFELVIPEKDFFDPWEPWERTWTLRLDRLKQVEALAAALWAQEPIDCIQTGWELSDSPVPYADIAAGRQPQIEPFCILPKALYRRQWPGTVRPVERDGVCIRDISEFQLAE